MNTETARETTNNTMERSLRCRLDIPTFVEHASSIGIYMNYISTYMVRGPSFLNKVSDK
jgi:hypothetical protein